jgi:DNA-directed RNA polymerase subunit RPC12/RpoP
MDIEFTCNKCGQHIVIDGAGGGLAVECPSCSANLIVPVADKTADDPASDFFRRTRELKKPLLKKLSVCFSHQGQIFPNRVWRFGRTALVLVERF